MDVTGTMCSFMYADLVPRFAHVQVWDIATEKVSQRFIGHEGTVSCLSVSADGKYLASGSSSGDDRYINLWRIEADSDSSPQAAYRTFVIDSVPTSLSFNRPQGKKTSGIHELVAVAESGMVSVWTFKEGKKPSKTPSSQVSLAEAEDVSQSAQVLFAARICKEKTLRIAAGQPLRPWFETISLVDSDSGEAEPSILVPRREAASSLAGASARSSTRTRGAGGDSGEVAVIGSGELSLPSSKDAESTGRRKRVEITMGERAADASVVMEDAAAAPKADSSAVLLTQALKNEDSALLEDCLSCRDHALITNTVRRLPVTSVLPFLKQVSNRVRSKPGRASTLVFWIRAVLTEHTAYLTSVPAAGGVLAELFQAADARLGNFDRFLKLQGRLDLIMAHISHRRNTGDHHNSVAAATFVHREAGAEDEEDDDEDDEDDEDGDGMDESGSEDEEDGLDDGDDDGMDFDDDL